MHHLFSDVRFALRLMKKSPGFYGTLLAVLFLGIGATTAMISIVTGFLLRPLPCPHPEELTMIWGIHPMGDEAPVSLPDYLDWKAGAPSFSHMAATEYESFSLSSDGKRAEHLPGAHVSGEFFPLFGVRPLVGRLLGPEDDKPGGARVAVLSAAVFRERFASDAGIVGRTVMLSSQAFTVVGVAPDGFSFSGPNNDRCDVWVPMAVGLPEYARLVTERGNRFLHVMGRRKPGVSLERAQAELDTAAKRIAAAYPEGNTNFGVRAVDLHEELVGSSRQGVNVLLFAVGLVFLAVCANVANLLLTRAASRRGEMATRSALGASRSRIVRQIVTETLVVFFLGTIGGAVLAHWLVEFFARGLLQGGGGLAAGLGVDAPALTVSALVCLGCGVLFGLLPALEAARVEPQTVLAESATRAGVSRAQRAVRGALVVAQVSLAFVLLAGSGLTLRAFTKLASTPPGFDGKDLATGRLVLPETKYQDDAKALAFYREVLARVAALPGVTAVAANSTLPMGGSNSNGSFLIEGRPPFRPGERPRIARNSVTPGYFATMKVPLLRGREFSDTDTADGRLVTLISQTAAERFFPGEDPIGRRLDYGDHGDDTTRWREIVGVVGDVRKRSLAAPIEPEGYLPLAQSSNRWMVVVARSPRATEVLKELPAIVAGVDAELAVASRKLMEERLADSVRPERFLAQLLGAFAAAALFLATLGLFGLVSYATSQRTREIGIRMALGSTPEAAVALVMRSGLRLLGIGLALGFGLALALGGALAKSVRGVDARDPAIFGIIPVVLGVAGLVACLLPALRAVRIPPASALRYE